MLKRVTRAVGALLLSATVALGCAAADMKSAGAPAPMAPGGYAEAAPMASAMPMEAGGLAAGFPRYDMDGAVATNGPAPAPTATGTQASEAFQQHGPMLIYTASINLAVFQVVEASKEVEHMAREAGGFLARRDDTSLVIRVPASKFEDVIKRIEKLGDVLHRSVSADDVSEQYTDLEGRLVNLRGARQRLQEFLARAGTMADMLQVQRELERVAA